MPDVSGGSLSLLKAKGLGIEFQHATSSVGGEFGGSHTQLNVDIEVLLPLLYLSHYTSSINT